MNNFQPSRSCFHLFVRPEIESYALHHPGCSCEELCAAVSSEIMSRYSKSSMIEELLKTIERQAPIIHFLLVEHTNHDGNEEVEPCLSCSTVTVSSGKIPVKKNRKKIKKGAK